MKSIKSKLIFLNFTVISAIAIIISMAFYYHAKNEFISQIRDSVTVVSEEGAKIIKSRLDIQLDILETIGLNHIVASNMTLDEKLNLLHAEAQRLNYVALGITDANGYSIRTDGYELSIHEREHFKKALSGEKYVSDILISKATNKRIVIFAVPIYKEGIISGVLYGVKAAEDLDFILRSTALQEKGLVSVINRNGEVIAFTDISHNETDLELEEKNSNRKDMITQAEPFLLDNDTSNSTYIFDTDSNIVALTAIDPNWFLLAELQKDNLFDGINRLRLNLFIITAVIITGGIGISCLLGYSYTYPILDVINQVRSFGEYDSSAQINFSYKSKGNEIDKLIESCLKMHNNIQTKNKELELVAYYDHLTKLPNKEWLNIFWSKRADAAYHSSQSSDFAILLFDIDNFKIINELYGHSVGDKALLAITQRLKASICEEYAIVRISSDEFAIIKHGILSKDEAGNFAGFLLTLFEDPIYVDNLKLNTAISIGIATYPENGSDIYTLIQSAEVAMHQAKNMGKNTFCFYTDALQQKLEQVISIENDLRTAVINGEFDLVYQPQVELKTGSIIGVEALIRWHHPQKGMITPDVFIPIAEKTGAIVDIGKWVLEKACSQMVIWQCMGLSNASISVNISPFQLNQPSFAESVRMIIDSTGLEPNCLQLEITEGLAINNLDRTIQHLQAIKDMGVKLSIDDFGMGYSSLNYLNRLPIHEVKIDRAFIKDIDTNRYKEYVAQTIIQLCHRLNLKVVAEGVERYEQAKILLDHNCDIAQGYLYYRPVPGDNLIKILLDKQHASIKELTFFA